MTSFDLSWVVTEFALNWFLQSTLLILVSLAAAHVLRKRGAAVQSAIYRTTLVAVLICPLATWCLSQAGVSGWSVELPKQWRPGLVAEVAEIDSAERVVDVELAELAPSDPVAVSDPSLLPAQNLPSSINAGLNDSDALPASDQLLGHVDIAEPSALVASAHSEADSTAGFASFIGAIPKIAVAVWALVALVMLIRLASAWRKMHQLRQHAADADQETVEACRRLAAKFQVNVPDVLRSPYLPSPCLAGLVRPAVLLPDEDQGLSVREVLIHELAHLRRQDCHWNLLRQIATALFNFQPLLWVLSRRLETTAEEVCDDYVVQFGGDRQQYAHRLVEIAELSISPIAPAGVGMVSFRSMLGSRVERILDTSRTLSTQVGNLILALVLIGGFVGTAASGLVGLSPLAEKVIPEVISVANGSATTADDDDENQAVVTVAQGTIVDPDGKPFAGAAVYATLITNGVKQETIFKKSRRIKHEVLAKTESDSTGKFNLDWADVGIPDAKNSQHIKIIAKAKNFGPAYQVGLVKPELTLKLKRSEAINGRVLNFEGTPVVGAQVSVFAFRTAKNEQAISDWIDSCRKKTPPKTLADYFNSSMNASMNGANTEYPQRFPTDWKSSAKWHDAGLAIGSILFPKPVATDGDGRFVLEGLAADQLVVLRISGAGIADTVLPVVTREMKPVHAEPFYGLGIRSDIHYGKDLEVVVEAGQSMVGTVTDVDTGEPITNSEVRLDAFTINNTIVSNTITYKVRYLYTRTDELGGFELNGLPLGGGYDIAVFTNDQPYFPMDKRLPRDNRSFEPISLDFALKCGKWIVGKLTESRSGEPVSNVAIKYLPTTDNKHAIDYPFYQQKYIGSPPFAQYHTNEKGEYRILAIPGKGILATAASNWADKDNRFIKLRLDQVHADLISNRYWFNTHHPTSIYEYNSLLKIDLADNRSDAGHDLTITKGLTKLLKFVDQQGNPVEGVRVLGRQPYPSLDQPSEDTQVEIVCLRADEKRIVMLLHPEKKIGKYLRVSAEDKDQTATLEPCAIVRGRFLNEYGGPVSGVHVNVTVDAEDNRSRNLCLTKTDKEGRFEALLPPGRESWRVSHNTDNGPNFSIRVAPQAGDIFELGDIKDGTKLKKDETKKFKKKQNVSTKTASQTLKVVRGSVMNTNGDPISADLFVYKNRSAEPVLPGKSDLNGKFNFSVDATGIQNPRDSMLVAMSAEHGIDWVSRC